MWRVLQALLRGEEQMLGTSGRCSRRGPILVLATAFGGATHGTVRWVVKEGLTMEVMHVRSRKM